MANNQEMEDALTPRFIWATNYPRLCWWKNEEDPTLKLLCVINRPLDEANEDEAPYVIVKCEDSKFDNKAEAHAVDLTPAHEVGFGQVLPRHRVEVLVFAIRESYKFAVTSKGSEKTRSPPAPLPPPVQPPPAPLPPQVPVDPKVPTAVQKKSSRQRSSSSHCVTRQEPPPPELRDLDIVLVKGKHGEQRLGIVVTQRVHNGFHLPKHGKGFVTIMFADSHKFHSVDKKNIKQLDNYRPDKKHIKLEMKARNMLLDIGRDVNLRYIPLKYKDESRILLTNVYEKYMSQHLAETDPNGKRSSRLDLGYVRKRKLEIERENVDDPAAKRSVTDEIENQPSTSRAELNDSTDSTESYLTNPNDCPEIRITPPHEHTYEF